MIFRFRVRGLVMGSVAPGTLGPTVKLMRFRAHKHMRFSVRVRVKVRARGLVMGPWAPRPLGPTVKLMRFRAHIKHEI